MEMGVVSSSLSATAFFPCLLLLGRYAVRSGVVSDVASQPAPAQGGSRNDVPAVPKLEVQQQGEQDELLHTSGEVGKPSGYLIYYFESYERGEER